MVGPAVARGAYAKNSKLFRARTWKGYHNDSSMNESIKAVDQNVKMGPDEKGAECHVDGYGGSYWGPHHRSGIYYPRGQERVMEDVPTEAGKREEVMHYFSGSEDVHSFGFGGRSE